MIVNALAVQNISIPSRCQSPSQRSASGGTSEHCGSVNTTHIAQNTQNTANIKASNAKTGSGSANTSNRNIDINPESRPDTPSSTLPPIGPLPIPKLQSQTNSNGIGNKIENQIQNKGIFSFTSQDQSVRSTTQSVSHGKFNHDDKSMSDRLSRDQQMLVKIMAQNTTLVCMGVSTSIIVCFAFGLQGAFPTYCAISFATLIASADVTVNIVCLSLQWSFSINLYQKLCFICDRCIKHCYSQRMINDME